MCTGERCVMGVNAMMSDMKQAFWRRGFTLIELLVVISIIGILSGILYVSFGGAKDDARNKSLQAELKEVQLAIELYKAQNGRYPEANTSCDSYNGLKHLYTADTTTCGTTPLTPKLIPDFIAELPLASDSGNSACNIKYQTDDSGTLYRLVAEHCAAGVNGTTGVQAGDELARCLAGCPSGCGDAYRISSDFYESYAIYSAGGACEL